MRSAVLIILIITELSIYPQQLNTKSKSQLSRHAIEIIVKNIKSDDSEIKSYAIESISKTGETNLIPILKKYLEEPNKHIVISAAKALWNLGDKTGIKKLYDIAQTPPEVDLTKNDPLTQLKIISTNKIREKAISAISELEGIKARDILLKLKENDNFGIIRDVAARELAKIGYKNEIETFYSALISEDEQIRNQAAESLSKICPVEVSKIIQALKKEKSIRVKILMIDSLRCAKFQKNEEKELINLLSSENQTIRIKAITALLNSKNSEVIEMLKKIYYDTPDILTKLIILKKLLEDKNFSLNCDDIDYLNSIEKSEIKRKFIEVAPVEMECSKRYLEKYLNDNDPYVAIDAAVRIIETERKK